VFCPDEEARDKTKCVYCGIELADWLPSDMPAEVSVGKGGRGEREGGREGALPDWSRRLARRVGFPV
jgi:hypothetical protein